MNQIQLAAKMAGDWWAERLDQQHEDKRLEFSAAVAKRVEAALISDGWVTLECDYDPHGILLEVVKEVIDPNCRGFLFSARGILPQKHELDVTAERLKPKEGYGRWSPEISVDGRLG